MVAVGSGEVHGRSNQPAKNGLIALPGCLCHLYHQPSSIDGVSPAVGVASPLEPVNDGGNPTGGEPQRAGEVGRRQRPLTPDHVESAHVGPVQPVQLGGDLIKVVHLAAEVAEAGDDIGYS